MISTHTLANSTPPHANHRATAPWALAVGIAALLALPAARAASLTWTAAENGNWNTTDANWNGSVWNNAAPWRFTAGNP